MAPENSSSSKDTKTSPTSISASNYELDEPYHFPQPKTSLFSDIDQNVPPGKKDIERKPQEVDKLNENSKVLTEKNEFSDFKVGVVCSSVESAGCIFELPSLLLLTRHYIKSS